MRSRPGRRKMAVSIIVIILAVGVIAIGVSQIMGGIPFLSPSTTASMGPTWQQFGFSVQHPQGWTMQTLGVASSQATADSGEVRWTSANGSSAFSLIWLNTTSFDVQAAFQNLQGSLNSSFVSVALVNSGSVSLAGVSWEYQNYQLQGQSTIYASYAFRFSPASGHVFELSYVDDAPDTYLYLVNYGNTLQA